MKQTISFLLAIYLGMEGWICLTGGCWKWSSVVEVLSSCTRCPQEVIWRGFTGTYPPGKSPPLGKEELDWRWLNVYSKGLVYSSRGVCSVPRDTQQSRDSQCNIHRIGCGMSFYQALCACVPGLRISAFCCWDEAFGYLGKARAFASRGVFFFFFFFSNLVFVLSSFFQISV